jgi:TPP-dependent trihydroxycyclohexane-1,2-dione (THcHDO) dehydratase
LDRILADRDRINAGKLTKAKEEVEPLKQELAKAKNDHAAELISINTAHHKALDEQKELTSKAVREVSIAQKQIDEYAGQEKVWLAVLEKT